MNLLRYNDHDDLVLQEIASAIKPYLPLTTSKSVDINDGYHFPCHIVPTDLRPDIVWWDPSSMSVCLNVCFEMNFDDAADRRQLSTQTWCSSQWGNGYRATLLTLQVGSRGVPHYHSFQH